MNFGKKSVLQKQKKLISSSTRIASKLRVLTYRFFLIASVAAVIILTFAGFGVLRGLIDTAPSIDSIDVIPNGYSTNIYSQNGKLIQTLVGKDANRVYVTIDKVPDVVQNAFVAIEDERFWHHDGIDVQGIFRAFYSDVTGNGFSQGASTLTQQLLKNQVFNGGKEKTLIAKIQRKIQEQYLAIQLENKLDKKAILEYYLNTINLGQNTLGVQAASQRYFGKDVSELTLSEASVLAGITQNPSAYNPISNPDNNKQKRQIVLNYMKEQGYINEADYQNAINDDVYTRIQILNEKQIATNSVNSYFVDALYDQVLKDLKEKLGYTETQAYNAIYRGGLEIYSTQNSTIQKICDKTMQDETLFPADSEWQLSYQLSIKSADGTEKNYNEQTLKAYFLKQIPSFDIYFKKKSEAVPYIEEYKKSLLQPTDTITGEIVNYIVQPQISFVMMDQKTGEVQALVGGRGKKTANRTLNRSTDTLRQPGSTFKILSTYLPALDTAGMTLATVMDDAPYSYPNTNKQVRNWTGTSSYEGLTSLREGIYNSMNIVTVKTLEKVTPKTGYDYLKNLGFTSLVDSMTNNDGETFSDIQLPMALGGLTKGVSNLELTSAFASVANEGMYNKPILYTKVVDHDGNVLLENKPAEKQVMKDTTAWLLTSAMEDVVNIGTGTKVKFTDSNGITLAGKTGTTSNDIDLWFVGYTPYYTAGIWGGYDLNKNQNNTIYHKLIWKTIMEKINNKLQLQAADFKKPDSIVTAKICTKCGKLAVDGLCDRALGGSCVKTEYFAKGTEPTETCVCHILCNICSASGKLANERCPQDQVIQKVFLLKDEANGETTADSKYIIPPGLKDSLCDLH